MSATATEKPQASGVLLQQSRFPYARLRSLWRFIRTKPMGAVGGAILLVLVLSAVFGPVLATHDPLVARSRERLLPPSAAHWMGTDEFGRDVYSRLLYGSQLSVGIGISAIALSLTIACAIGMFSAYRLGAVDLILQRLVDGVMSIPTLVILLAATVVLGQGVVTLVLLIGFLFGVRTSRVVRSAVLSIKQNDYIVAARALGASDLRIILRHIAPNIFAPIMILATVELGGVILTEASLSFLNLGIPPPTVSWGQMLALTGLPYMHEAPWMVLAPGLTITAVVFGVNVLGDALRDALDPRLRGGA